MTADRVTAKQLRPHDMIRARHKHDVPGMACRIGCREIDVEVISTHFASLDRLVVECQGCSQFLGSRASLVLVLVLEPTEPVMRLGSVAA